MTDIRKYLRSLMMMPFFPFLFLDNLNFEHDRFGTLIVLGFVGSLRSGSGQFSGVPFPGVSGSSVVSVLGKDKIVI